MVARPRKGSNASLDLRNSVPSPARFNSIQMHPVNMYLQHDRTGMHPQRGQQPCGRMRACGTELGTVEKAPEQRREKNEASGLLSIATGLGEQQRTACDTLPSNGKEHIVQVAIKYFS